MTATTVPASATADRSWAHAPRVALIALAIIILLAVSFVVGRATATTTHRSPAATAPVAAATSGVFPGPSAIPRASSGASTESCHVRRPC
jgi:hypothetical protein